MTYQERRDAFVEGKRRLAEWALPEDPDFEDYLLPHGEYGLPIYTGLSNERDIVERIVSRRAEFIRSQHDIPEREAFALSAAQASLPAGWVAEQVGVTVGTVGNYHDRVEEKLGVGVLVEEPFCDIRREMNVGVKSYRECPDCGDESIESVREVGMIYNNSAEVLERADENDTHVCTSCGIALSREVDDEDPT